MTYSTHIRRCEECLQNYCCECCDAKDWQRFCSIECEDQWHKDIHGYDGKDQHGYDGKDQHGYDGKDQHGYDGKDQQ
jgi:hypothetical protein